MMPWPSAQIRSAPVPRLEARRLHAIARNAFRRFEATLSAARPQPVACRSGCSHCCRSLTVSISLPEIFLLKAHIDALPDRESAAIKARILQAGDDGHGAAGSRVCPLLDGEQCGVYAARPLSCRAAVSLDATMCRRGAAGEPVRIEMPAAYPAALQSTALKLKALLAAAGLDCRGYELKAALRIAFETPDVEQRWLAGEDPFAPAEMLA